MMIVSQFSEIETSHRLLESHFQVIYDTSAAQAQLVCIMTTYTHLSNVQIAADRGLVCVCIQFHFEIHIEFDRKQKQKKPTNSYFAQCVITK